MVLVAGDRLEAAMDPSRFDPIQKFPVSPW